MRTQCIPRSRKFGSVLEHLLYAGFHSLNAYGDWEAYVPTLLLYFRPG